MSSKPHHRGTYTTHARTIRAWANANPDTQCWRCGRTLDQHPPHRNGQPATWQAGHLTDSQAGGPLAPEASTCNTTAGAIYGNKIRTRTGKYW